MGQYYKGVILRDNEVKGTESIEKSFTSYDYSNGAKLLEHSYIGNVFVSAVERELLKEPKRVVWAGDYADAEPGNLKCEIEYEEGKFEEAEDVNIYMLASSVEGPYNGYGKKKGMSLAKKYRYIVNVDKGEFVDKEKCPSDREWEDMKIHPLPLLTCEGNGRGGGDYRREHPLVGTWARDNIQIVTRRPKGMQELIPNFQE